MIIKLKKGDILAEGDFFYNRKGNRVTTIFTGKRIKRGTYYRQIDDRQAKLIDLRYKDIGERRRAKYKYPHNRIDMRGFVMAMVQFAFEDEELKSDEERRARIAECVVSKISNNYRRRKRG